MSGKVWNYVYNTENQLIEANLFDGTTKLKSVAFFYDAMGRRVKKSVLDIQNSNAYERRYSYDGSEMIAELDEENNILARYTHSGLRTDDVLSTEITSAGVARGLATATGNYLFLKDGLGSVQMITDEAGSIVQRYIYSSFGKLLKVVDSIGLETTAFKTAYTYTNRELDEETGLYYYRARYYDSSSGRFMQEDPHPGYLYKPQSHNNKFIYANSNPTFYIDPQGQEPLTIIIAVVIFTLIETALQSAVQDGSFWENFKRSFEKPFAGNGRGQFWDNLFFNSLAALFGVPPGFNKATYFKLAFSTVEADLDDQREEDGYKSNYLGFKVGQLSDIAKIYKFADRAYTAYEKADEFIINLRHIPVGGVK